MSEPEIPGDDGGPPAAVAGLWGLARRIRSRRRPSCRDPPRAYRSVVWSGPTAGGGRPACYVPPTWDPAPFAAAGEPQTAGPQHRPGRLTLVMHPLGVRDP